MPIIDIKILIGGFELCYINYLSMVYYHIQISSDKRKLCMIILQWGTYCYNHLIMVVSNSPDIFQ